MQTQKTPLANYPLFSLILKRGHEKNKNKKNSPTKVKNQEQIKEQPGIMSNCLFFQ